MLKRLEIDIDYGEDRWIALGNMFNRVVVLVFIEKHESTIRIISARKATKAERKIYEKNII